MQGYVLKRRFGRRAGGLMKLWCIEIGEANLDPLAGIGRLADAEFVSVANLADRAGEPRASLGRPRRVARICIGRCGGAERGQHAGKKQESPAHAEAFNMLLPFFHFRSARTKLCHLKTPRCPSRDSRSRDRNARPDKHHKKRRGGGRA